MNAPTEKERALANLRHLYTQMVFGTVSNTDQAKRIAEGLLSPAIALLERAPAVQVPRFNHAAKRKLEMLIESGESITGYAFQNKDGRRGSIDCHGFVAWWNDFSAGQQDPAAVEGATYREKWDAELGRTAMRFVDRAGDVHPGIDDADQICREFHEAMSAVINQMPHVQMMRAAAPQPPEATVKQQLTVEAAPVQIPCADDFSTKLAELRDLFPIPAYGSEHEARWMASISDPAEVLAYVTEQVRQLLANHGTQEKQG